MDKRKWEEEALNACLPGIRAKFYQNTNVMDTLLNKTGMKRIVECTSDGLWGTGVPLGDPECLDQTKWISQGILGQILECIREEVVNCRRHFYHQPPPTSRANTDDQMTHQIIPNLRHEADNATSTSGSIVPDPATVTIGTTSIIDDRAGTESSISASTTPTSDTTASNTDPGDSQSHYQSTSPMEGMQPLLNSS